MHFLNILTQTNKNASNGGMTVEEKNQKYTVAGTDIEAIKEQARRSGLSYNEAIEWIAKTTGGRGTHIYSDTDVEAVKKQNERAENAKRN